MSILICFDVDGTLSTSGGLVPWEWVETAVRRWPDIGEIAVAIVSPSAAWPREANVQRFTEGARRRDNLIAARVWRGGADLRLYVSDNGDQEEARAAGFALIHPADFALAIG